MINNYTDPFTVGNQFSNIANSDVKIPAWLDPNNASNFSELTSLNKNLEGRYNDILGGVRGAANDTISYQTSMGGQAANSAAREYAARELQAGGTASGAGVVRAQSLLPIFAANAGVRANAADKVAQIQTDALKTQGSIASQLAQLRTSYAGTLANYITQNRSQQLQGSQLDLQSQQQQFTQTEAQKADQFRALQLALNQQAPNSMWTQDNYGHTLTGQASRDTYDTWSANRATAMNRLSGLL